MGDATGYDRNDAAYASAAEAASSTPDGVALSGHRGAGADDASSLAPENTITAFETARDIGMDAVEFDVRVTRDEEFVVIHDATTSRTTPASLDVEDTPLDALIGLRADRDYTDIGTAQSMSHEAAEGATVPSLDDVLDYLSGTDMLARIEFKGRIREEAELGRAVYEEVKEHGMVDQAVFMSYPGTSRIPANPFRSRQCSWEGLDGVVAASDGAARTAVLWQKRKDPRRGIANAKKLHLAYTLNEAETRGYNIVVARDGRNGLGGLGTMDRDAFVDAVQSRGLDYAFMGFDGSLEEELAYGVEWVSRNRIDRLMETVQDLDSERYNPHQGTHPDAAV